MKKPEISIVILNYNTKSLLKDCLDSLERVKDEASFEIIVADNGSGDGSQEMIKKDFKWVKLVENNANLGFAAGNNRAKDSCRGNYVLFLNTDTIVKKGALKETLNYLKKNKKVAAVSCRVELVNGELDKDTRRSFPTPWVSLTHLALHLDRIFPKSKLFAKYWYGYIPDDVTHEVDVLQGAFFLVRKKVLDDVGWFDEDYFLDGEDIDLCWKIKKAGWKLIYYSKVKIIHLKGATKGKNKEVKKRAPLRERLKFRMAGVNSMEIFYRKRMWHEYPLLLNLLVIFGIKCLKALRMMKIILQ
ncbi:MAG: glycosyltransferase family 2 protein [Patescibacteria group bacterium]|jgi:hypothetical protein